MRMLDIKLIRHQPNYVKVQLGHRGVDPATIDQVIDLDQQRRLLLGKSERLKRQRKLESTINQSDQTPIRSKTPQLRQTIKQLDLKIANVEKRLNEVMLRLPNVPNENVPIGLTAAGAKELRRVGQLRDFSFEPRPHWKLGESLGILDFQRGVKVSGSRFVYYVGDGAKLARALYNFFLDEHAKEGYTEVLPPYLVTDQSMYGTGQFPKFQDEAFRIREQGLTLIPTAEVPLVNYYRDEVIPSEKLPINFTALTPSFREEAGKAGRDTRGLIRLHQFNKVEMVKFVRPEDSWKQLEVLTNNAESILKKLGLPYRVITLTTSDMSFTAAMTHDLEIWFPAQNKYREVSSCSNCTDFQARRAHIQFRDEKGKLQFVHTLNGSGLAVGRTLAAVLENYQNEDGTVDIPAALVPYMHGQTKLEPKV